MEKISKAFQDHKKFVIGSLVVGSALTLGYYAIKRSNDNVEGEKEEGKESEVKWNFNASFGQPNVPLLHQHTVTRAQMVSEVSYSAIMFLEKGETYSGKMKVEFTLADKDIDELEYLNETIINELGLTSEK